MPNYTGNQGIVTIGMETFEVTNWSYTGGINAIDTTKQGESAATGRSFISDGLRGGTASIEIDLQSDTDVEIVTGSAVTCLFADELQTLHFSGITTSRGNTVVVGDKATITVDLQAIGAVIMIGHAYGLEVDTVTLDAGTNYDIKLDWSLRYGSAATDEQEVWRRTRSGTNWQAWAVLEEEILHNAVTQTVQQDFAIVDEVQYCIRVRDTSESGNPISWYSNIVSVLKPT